MYEFIYAVEKKRLAKIKINYLRYNLWEIRMTCWEFTAYRFFKT